MQRRHRIMIAPDIYQKIEGQARGRRILPETLINLWLTERLQEGH